MSEVMPKDPRKEAEKSLDQAEHLLEHEKFSKAGKEFNKTGEMFIQLRDYKVAEQCYFYGAKAFLSANKFEEAVEIQRNAANACIMLNDYKKAGKYYQIAAKYALRVEKVFDGILNGSFAYLCLFIQGQQDRGLEYIKELKRKVPFDDFKENRLVQLVRSLTLTIIERNQKELANIEANISKFKFRDSELQVILRAIVLAKVHVALSFELNFERTQYITDEIIEFTCTVDATELANIAVPPGIDLSISEIIVKDIGIALSENLSVKRKSTVPFTLHAGEKLTLEFQLRANYPSENSFAGPIVLTCEVGDAVFFAKSESQSLVIKSPPAKLGVFMKPNGTPLIGKTFPMEVTISNDSEGEATNIEIELEFPENLRLMRGMAKKTLYSIAAHNKLSFQVSLQPLEPGDAPIRVTMTFKDADGNVIGPNSAELPFEINL
ncbi:MAG TPA: hypothetical protein VKK79_10085 [Candidatus Lokiarchaeia archaeon]|nr:hypothetical protein [Candidatus Lokiarchaeia archaeon]